MPWICPTCAPKIALREKAVEAARKDPDCVMKCVEKKRGKK